LPKKNGLVQPRVKPGSEKERGPCSKASYQINAGQTYAARMPDSQAAAYLPLHVENASLKPVKLSAVRESRTASCKSMHTRCTSDTSNYVSFRKKIPAISLLSH